MHLHNQSRFSLFRYFGSISQIRSFFWKIFHKTNLLKKKPHKAQVNFHRSWKTMTDSLYLTSSATNQSLVFIWCHWLLQFFTATFGVSVQCHSTLVYRSGWWELNENLRDVWVKTQLSTSHYTFEFLCLLTIPSSMNAYKTEINYAFIVRVAILLPILIKYCTIVLVFKHLHRLRQLRWHNAEQAY